MSHELLYPESVKDVDKTVSFCTLQKEGVTYSPHATGSEAGVNETEGMRAEMLRATLMVEDLATPA